MVTGYKGWKEAALERIYIYTIYNTRMYSCGEIRTRLRIEFGFHPDLQRNLPDSDGLRWDFAFPRSFISTDAPPFLRATRRLSKGDLVCHKHVYGWLRNSLLDAGGDNIEPSNGNVTCLRAVITRRISKDGDTLGFYALFAPSIYEGIHVSEYSLCYSYIIDRPPPYKVRHVFVQIFENHRILVETRG